MNIPAVHKIFGGVKDPAPNPIRAVIAFGSWCRRDGTFARGVWSEFLPVRGRPVIDYIMDELRSAGFSEIECVFYLEPDALAAGVEFRDEDIISDWNLRARDIAYRHKRSFAGLGSIIFRAPLNDLSLEASLLRVAEDHSFAPFLLVFPSFVSMQGAADLARLLEAYRAHGASVMTVHRPKREALDNNDWRMLCFEAALSGAPRQVCSVLLPGRAIRASHDTSLTEACFSGRIVVNEALLSCLARLRTNLENPRPDLRIAMQDLADGGLFLAQELDGDLFNCSSVDGLLAANASRVDQAIAVPDSGASVSLFDWRARGKP